MLLETRLTPDCKIEVREADGQAPKLAGYAAVFNRLSEPLGRPPSQFRERIAPGAFDGWPDVKALVGHNRTLVLGREGAGTLALRTDTYGLAVEIDPPDTGYGRDAVTSVRRGDIIGMSFGFLTPEGGDTFEMENGVVVRTLNKVILQEVSITAFGAYLDASIAVRSLEAWQEQEANKAQVHRPGALGVFKRRLQLFTR